MEFCIHCDKMVTDRNGENLFNPSLMCEPNARTYGQAIRTCWACGKPNGKGDRPYGDFESHQRSLRGL